MDRKDAEAKGRHIKEANKEKKSARHITLIWILDWNM